MCIRDRHDPYEYVKKVFVPRREGGQCTVSVYSIPPQKCAYPYHYHTKNEEVFFILQGDGVLRIPKGEQPVTAGDFLFFPAEESGAHKLTNPSLTEPLVYKMCIRDRCFTMAFTPWQTCLICPWEPSFSGFLCRRSPGLQAFSSA